MNKQYVTKHVKRCPHCNTYFGGATLWESWAAHWWQRKYNLECNYCKWNSKQARTKRGAIRKWNRDKERKKEWLRKQSIM